MRSAKIPPSTSNRELTYWLQYVGLCVVLVLLAVVRFALAVVVRVIEVGTSLVCIIAGLALVLYLVAR